MDSLTRVSKRLSYVLRHDPGSVGLTLDANGWVDVALLLDRLSANGFHIDRDTLDRVVAENDKRRFTIDGARIRANQGHSVDVDLALEPRDPPPVLFHGTTSANLDSILRDGLTRRQRHHVHLSADVETAERVGARHGKPVVLRVAAAEMTSAGHVFHRSDNGVWLTDAVPSTFISRHHEEPATP